MLTDSMIKKFTRKIQQLPSNLNQSNTDKQCKNSTKQSVLRQQDSDNSNQYFPPSYSEKNSNSQKHASGNYDDHYINYSSECLKKDNSDSSEQSFPSYPLESFNEDIDKNQNHNTKNQNQQQPNKQQNRNNKNVLQYPPSVRQELKQKMKNLLEQSNGRKLLVDSCNQDVKPEYLSNNKKYIRQQANVQLNHQQPVEQESDSKTMNEGSNYCESDIREFIITFIDNTQGKTQKGINQAIRLLSKNIRVFPYQIRLWAIAYRIALKVEKVYGRAQEVDQKIKTLKNRSQEDIALQKDKQKIIQIQFLQYLKQNPIEKQYRAVKILYHIARIVKIIEIKPKQFIKRLILKHRSQLANVDLGNFGFSSPQIQIQARQYQQIKTSNRPKSQEYKQQKQQIKKLTKYKPNNTKIDDDYSDQPQNRLIIKKAHRLKKEANKYGQVNLSSLEQHESKPITRIADFYQQQSSKQDDGVIFTKGENSHQHQDKSPLKNRRVKDKKSVITNKRRRKQNTQKQKRRRNKFMSKQDDNKNSLKEQQSSCRKVVSANKSNSDQQQYQINAFPQFFKRNVACKLDEIFRAHFDNLLQNQAKDMCIPKNILQQIYQKYGHIQVVKQPDFNRDNKPNKQIIHSTEQIKFDNPRKTNKSQLKKGNRRSSNTLHDNNNKQSETFHPRNNSKIVTSQYSAMIQNQHTDKYVNELGLGYAHGNGYGNSSKYGCIVENGGQADNDGKNNKLKMKIKLNNRAVVDSSQTNKIISRSSYLPADNIQYVSSHGSPQLITNTLIKRAPKILSGNPPIVTSKGVANTHSTATTANNTTTTSYSAKLVSKQQSCDDILMQLQNNLAEYLQNNPNYEIKQLQRVTDAFMLEHRFSIKQKNEVRSKWFAYFIRKYNIRIPGGDSSSSRQQTQKSNPHTQQSHKQHGSDKIPKN